MNGCECERIQIIKFNPCPACTDDETWISPHVLQYKTGRGLCDVPAFSLELRKWCCCGDFHPCVLATSSSRRSWMRLNSCCSASDTENHFLMEQFIYCSSLLRFPFDRAKNKQQQKPSMYILTSAMILEKQTSLFFIPLSLLHLLIEKQRLHHQS